MNTRIDAALDVHADAMQLRARRTRLLATNIANVDTPNYKARDLVFGDTLARAMKTSLPMRSTDSRHIPLGRNSTGVAVHYRNPEAPSLDGNTVDKDMEQARFAENALRYQASVQFLQNRVGSLIRSLKGENA